MKYQAENNMVIREKVCLHTCHIPVLIRLAVLLIFLQNGDCECIYNFQGIQNGITFGLNIDYSDTVFKFVIVNKTGHIMSNKHVMMITDYSRYYYVSEDNLLTRRCPNPGLVEDILFGIKDEISCDVAIKVTAKKAISELNIPGEITAKIDGQTLEPEILVFQLHLNATKECASYRCEITCKNKKRKEFRISAGTSEQDKALFNVYTAPHSIQYSTFKYPLLFKCYDIHYPFKTQITENTNITFIDISVTSSTETTTLSTDSTSGTTLLREVSIKKGKEKLSSIIVLLPSLINSALRTRPITSFDMMTAAANHWYTVNPSSDKIPKRSRTSTIYSVNVLTTASESGAVIYSEHSTSKPTPTSFNTVREVRTSTQSNTQTLDFDLFSISTASLISSIGSTQSKTPNNNDFIPFTSYNYVSTEVEYSVTNFAESFSYTSNSNMSTLKYKGATVLSTLIIISNTYYTATSLNKNATVSSGSIFEKPTNVIALSTLAGVATAGAVGTGAYTLTSKRCNTVGNENKESEETEDRDSPDKDLTSQQQSLPESRSSGGKSV